MLAGPGNGHTVQQFKEIKIQHAQQSLCRSLFYRLLAPVVKCTLGIPENFFNGSFYFQFIFKLLRFPFISQCQLIPQIGKAVVYRCGRKHQDFGSYAGPYHSFHQSLVTVFFCVAVRTNAITEVVRFINHAQVIVTPVNTAQINTVRVSTIPGQVGMEEHIVAQPVICNGIVNIVTLISIPILTKFFGTKHQNRLVSVFIIFYNRKSGEGFAQANTVCQNAAIVFFQFINDCQSCIFLEIVQQSPNLAVLETCGFIWQHIFADVFQKFAEYVIQHKEIYKVRSIFVISGGNAFYYKIGNVLQFAVIVPNRFKYI